MTNAAPRAKWITGLLAFAVLAAIGQTKPQSNQQIGKSANQQLGEALRLNNLGAAYMGQQKFEPALKMFQQAAALDPTLRAAQVNQGIALLNLQRLEPARNSLLQTARKDADNARAWYNLGLLYKAQGQAAEALEAFQRAARLAPQDADSSYFAGLMLAQLKRNADAMAEFRRALELNPFHVSAEFGLARAYRAIGDDAEAQRHLARFQQLTETKLGAPISLAYGDQGPLSLAEQARTSEQAVLPALPVHFTPVSEQAGLASGVPGASDASPGFGACFFDFNGDGAPDLFLAAGGGQAGMALYRNSGKGKFEDVSRTTGFDPQQRALACAAADYDNDGHADLAMSFADHVALYRNQENGTFKNVSVTAGISGSAAGVTGLTWVDYDHDGDVDLYASSPGKPVLWRNNGNGTFASYGEQLALTASSSAASASTDYNNDRAIDLILTGAGPMVFANPREGKWPSSKPWNSPMPGATVGVAVVDFNKDGWMDLAFTHGSAPGLTLWRNQSGRGFTRVSLPDLNWKSAGGVVALDYDNDGWLDLAAVGEASKGHGELRLLRNEGPKGFRDVSAEVGLSDLAPHLPRGLVAADYDLDGDPDLLVTQAAGPVLLLRNDGGNRHNFLRLALKGLNDNKSAVGTKVEIFAGLEWQKFEIGAGGYLGSSSADLIVGLGNERSADVVRLLWPTGVLQDEAELAPGRPAQVTEIDRRGSSCPLLFVWDGRRYRFVSDMIGAGVIGHWVGPGQRNVPDPTEYIKLEGFTPAPRNGRLSLRFMEPMEEVVYLDQVRLLAVDHPRETDVYPNEFFGSNPPFAKYRVIASRGARPPASAWDHAGHDVNERLRHRDRQYVEGFKLLPFKGFTEPHTLELDLGAAIAGGPLRLLLHGYIEYFTATSMFAAHQAGIDPVAPYVEALGVDGRWTRVVDDMGFPAGLLRTMVADLTGRLPRGTRRIRLTTNLQIYWDQVLVDTTTPEMPVRTTELSLDRARLAFHGFPRAVERKMPGDLTYVYEDVSRTGPYQRQPGAYTPMGDVRELVSESDDRFVIFGPGDEVQLEFDSSGLAALPPGWKRDYFFFADGFEKDMDFYTAAGNAVAPLPYHAMSSYPHAEPAGYPADPKHLDYMLRNTRFHSGADARDYRFRFTRRRAGSSHEGRIP